MSICLGLPRVVRKCGRRCQDVPRVVGSCQDIPGVASICQGLLKELFRRPVDGGNTRHEFAPMCCFLYNLLVTLDSWSEPKLSLLGDGCQDGAGE